MVHEFQLPHQIYLVVTGNHVDLGNLNLPMCQTLKPLLLHMKVKAKYKVHTGLFD